MSDGLEISPADTEQALHDGSATVIDVRQAHELDEDGAVEGARHVELDQLTAEAGSIERDKPVIFFCHSGVRSLMAAQAFSEAGFDAKSMAGGIVAWQAEGRPLAS